MRQIWLLLPLVQGQQEYWLSHEVFCLTLDAIYFIIFPHLLHGGGGTLAGGCSVIQENSVPDLYTENFVTDSLDASDAFKDTLKDIDTDLLGALDAFKDTFEGITI